MSPKGCLKDVVNATAGEVAQGLITPECFNKLNLNLTNVTGGAGCGPRTFTVAFADQKKCAEGFDVIADGNLTAPKGEAKCESARARDSTREGFDSLRA